MLLFVMSPNKDDVRYIAQALRRLDTLGDKLSQAIILLEEYASVQEILSEINTAWPQQLDEIRSILIQLLQNQTERGIDTGQLIGTLERDQRNSWKRQLVEWYKTKNMLEEQAAEQGPNVDITLTKQIIKSQREIDHLNELLERDV